MKTQRFLFISWFLSAACCLLSVSSFSQANEKFGQNRVQYKSFTFQYYESDNFITHFYQGGQDIAKYAIKAAEDNADDIGKILDYKYKRKIDIIVYNNINELNQTNIGIYDQGQTPGGTVNVPDNKIFVYFNGDHRHLDKQIRESIAKLYLEKVMQGNGVGQLIQNAILLNLPDWYKYGLVKYIGQPWSSDDEDRLRDGIMSGRYQSLTKLPVSESVFVGQSIWHYIEEVHGKSAVSNIIYLTRVNRSVDNGFAFVLGTNLSETLQLWYNYYVDRYTKEAAITTMPAQSTLVQTKIKKDLDYYQPCVSADGKHVAYVSNDMGRYRVHLLNTSTGKKAKVIFRAGWRTNTLFTDQSIPLLAWDPSGKRLAFINDKRSNIYIRFYDVETKKTEKNPIRKFQKVVDFGFMDSKQLVMSAVQNGQTDIYTYTIASTTTRKITDDYFDDLNPAYVVTDSTQGILFTSNRESDTLQPQRYESQVMQKQHDLFFYDLNANGSVLYRVTSTPFANESYPQGFDENNFSYLSEENGIRNRHIGHFESVFDHNQKTIRFITKETEEEDSIQVAENIAPSAALDLNAVTVTGTSTEKVFKTGGVTAPYTNYNYNIRTQSVAKNYVLDAFRQNGKLQLNKYELNAAPASAAVMSNYMMQLQKRAIESVEEEKKKKQDKQPDKTFTEKYDTVQANRGNRPYDFQSEFDYGIKLFDWDSASASKLATTEQSGYVFRFSRVRPYFIRFMVDKVIAQVDNNIIMTRYQPFDPNVPQFNLNPVSFMFKFGITDLLENHKLYGGIRFPFAGISSNSEYFITYENLTKRWDTKFTFYRKSFSDKAFDRLPFSGQVLAPAQFVDYSIKTNYAELQFNYAIDVLNSYRIGLAFRNDKVVYKSQDKFSLNLPSISDNWLFLRTEYVFDNCIEIATNIRYGFRFKVFAEVHKQFPTKNKTTGNYDFPVVQFNNKVLGVFGVDMRHYLKVYRQIIWANRLAVGASAGTAKMIYYMGGLDNWITAPTFDKFDRNTPINRNNNYAFQTLATPLRGFKQNARNGDKFIVLNSELRVPIFAALIRRNLRSEIIRNFALVAFVDVGTAWEGVSPWSNDNPLFNESIPNLNNNPSVIVRVKRYKTPVIAGFGPGLRTSFLGYYIRIDAAWGYDTGEITKRPMYYFSFGLDF